MSADEVTVGDVQRAESLARLAARAGRGIDACPYEANGSEAMRFLAMRFVQAFTRAGGIVRGVVYGDDERNPAHRDHDHVWFASIGRRRNASQAP